MGSLINMGSLSLAELLQSAQDSGVDIELDVSKSENQVRFDLFTYKFRVDHAGNFITIETK